MNKSFIRSKINTIENIIFESSSANITESKKVQSKEGAQATFEKHKIFLYKEDFEKFIEGLSDVIGYIQQHNGDVSTKPANSNDPEENDTSDSGDIKLTIDF